MKQQHWGKILVMAMALWGNWVWGTEPVGGAANWDAVTSALQEHRYRQAAGLLETLARQGHVEAQFTLGVLYSRGTGVDMNERRAADWFEEAANQGHKDAQFRLGQFYQQGWGVPDSPSRANHWFQRCAAQGDGRCRLMIGEAAVPLASEARPKEPVPPITEDVIPKTELLSESWLTKQNPDHYTLQLMSSLRADDAREYARQQGLTGTVAVVATHRSGHVLYCLIYGSYPSAGSARRAQTELPAEVIKTGAWVRRFRELQSRSSENPSHLSGADLGTSPQPR